MEEYLPLKVQRDLVLQPFSQVEGYKDFDILIRVKGGGISGQADAMRLAIARALVLKNEMIQPKLKVLGFLTRDARKKERKKYGLAGARKRFQFSKR